ncbi:MAG: ATP-binding protein [Desulfobacterales bacterium]|nr:MAG: ATP-binding protein [Desulfobacterales bacterium]
MRRTNWYVITGAPCSGKTAVISGLEQIGHQVVHEVARAYIDEQLQKGQSIAQIKTDILSFESHILYKKIEIEQSLPESSVIFLDRAVPDSIAYYMIEGLNPDDPIQKSKLIRYKNIFLFERLRFEKDDVRSEDEKIAAQLDRLLQTSYEMLDYDIIYVPVMPVDKRIDFILERM